VECALKQAKNVDWEGRDDFDVESTGEAMIIGEPIRPNGGPPLVTRGALPEADGSSGLRLYYSLLEATALIDLSAVPVLRPRPVTHVPSPYEEMISKWIDGRTTVEEIASQEVLPRLEIIANLVAMKERGLIDLRHSAPKSHASDPPLLDAKFLAELAPEPSSKPRVVESIAPARKPPKRAPEPPPLKRAPSRVAEKATLAPDPPPLKRAPSRVVEKAAPPPTRAPSNDERIRHPQAARLYEQALLEKEQGLLVSAHTNIKLALAFEPYSALLDRTLRSLVRDLASEARGATPKAKVNALFEKAARSEMRDPEGAIALLEEAISIEPDARVLNRLGVILAMRNQNYARGRSLLEEAIRLSPDNDTYQHNLEKVRMMQSACEDEEKRNQPKPKGRVFGLFGRKRS
jgi:hypothetical protein